MCGIAGMVGSGPAEAKLDLLRRMNAVQRHRGPDDEGVFVDAGVGLSLVRLAVLDRSPAGRQPMSTPDGRYTIVHNGEVYNYLELRRMLEGTGPFTTGTDTEVILRAYTQWGPACVERFVGMFSFAIWDRAESVLFCARDRFGIKPFYYAEDGGRLVFASEIKALLQTGLPRRPCLAALHDYLVRGHYDHSSATFFDGVWRLPPGHTLTARPGEPASLRRYYWLPDRLDPQAEVKEEVAVATLRELLEDAVRLRLRADVRVGVSLSGGLDSSTLLALVDRGGAAAGEVEAFSCVYPEAGVSERPWIELMAKATRRPVHFSLMRQAELSRALEAMTWHQEEPFGGVPTLAWVGLYQATRRRGVTVLLDGSGLDDILGGYRHHHAAYLADLFRNGDHATFRAEFEGYQRAWRVDWRQALRDLQGAAQDDWTTKAMDASDPVRPECLTRDFLRRGPEPEPFPRPFGSPLKDLMFQGLAGTKIPRALRFKDRASMAFSRELRVPFLDHRLVEFCFGLPERFLVRDGMTKYLLRQAMAGLLPEEVRTAAKRSVPVPQREWLGSALREWVEAVLESRSFASRGIVDAPQARQQYRRFCGGERANSFYVWQWVNLEMWFRLFIDPPEVSTDPPAWPEYPIETVRP